MGVGGKASGWANWRAKNGGKDPSKFVGQVGRESIKASGKQGMHHHPQMSQLGNAMAKGMKPGGFTRPPKGC